MQQTPHLVSQTYWSSHAMPHVELRSTRNSTCCYKSHSHPQLSIGIIVEGATRLRSEGKDYMLTAGELVVIAPDTIHSCNPLHGKSRSYHMLYLDIDWCRQTLTHLRHIPATRIQCTPVSVYSADLFAQYRQLVTTLQCDTPDIANRRLKQLILSLFTHHCTLTEQEKHEHRLVQHMRQMLLNELSSPPSLKDMADILGACEETLIRIFHKATGLPPRAFVSNARVEKAKALLRTGQPIADTAVQLGFNDQSHFHKTFVKFVAATPRQYQAHSSIFYNP